MALKGIKVIEMAGLAPSPFCGMILSDFGAKVIRVDRTRKPVSQDCMGRGKQSVALDLKNKDGIKVFRKLCSTADVLIEPFRKGVMERMGLGPEVLLSDNPRLLYARLTGYGQKGPMSDRAGHDINYIGISGALSYFGRRGERPYPPVNVVADFAGGGLMCAFGIVMALFERMNSGKGQVIDANMVDGSAYVASWLWKSQSIGIWGGPRGRNVLDGGTAFYDVYETKDGKYMSVGALEPQFYRDLIIGLGLDPNTIKQTDDQEQMREQFRKIFLTKTRQEWTDTYKNLDACVEPLLNFDEAPGHPHNIENRTFLTGPDGIPEPGPAPKLSRTPAVSEVFPQPIVGQHTIEILKEAGFSDQEIDTFISSGAVEHNTSSKL